MSARSPTETSESAGQNSRLVGATGKAHRVAGATGVLVLVALLGMLGVGAADPAQAATAPNAPGITVTGVEVGGLMELTARLTGPDRHPLANADVAFLFTTTQFGTAARLVPLGSATTDATSVARLTVGGDVGHLYRPTTKGPQEFVATYAATGAQPVTSSATVNVTVARSAYKPAPPKPLAGVGNVLVVVLFAIVAAIWLTLITPSPSTAYGRTCLTRSQPAWQTLSRTILASGDSAATSTTTSPPARSSATKRVG